MPDIIVSPSPHISKALSTRSVMLDVIIALAPAMIMAGVYFRIRALLLIATCVISAMATEYICNFIRKKPNSLGDLSAVVTGIILALSLPPMLPLWTAVIGSAFAIAIGKMVFGGLGANTFNPAMVSRAFLTASFGMLMTTWTVPATINSDMPKIAPENTDTITQATPLAHSKQVIKEKQSADEVNKLFVSTLTGNISGCLGETSAIALLLGGIYLLIRKTISLHIPLAVCISALAIGTIAYLTNSQKFIQPIFHLTSGGMIFCILFIATDPVTAPLTKKGMWIFGAGVGILTMLIRIVGEYPEGIMYAILLMNAVTPLIDRLCKLTPAGGKPNA